MTATLERLDIEQARTAWKRHTFAKDELMEVWMRATELAEALRVSPQADVRLALADLAELVANMAFVVADWHIDEVLDIEREQGVRS